MFQQVRWQTQESTPSPGQLGGAGSGRGPVGAPCLAKNQKPRHSSVGTGT